MDLCKKSKFQLLFCDLFLSWEAVMFISTFCCKYYFWHSLVWGQMMQSVYIFWKLFIYILDYQTILIAIYSIFPLEKYLLSLLF